MRALTLTIDSGPMHYLAIGEEWTLAEWCGPVTGYWSDETTPRTERPVRFAEVYRYPLASLWERGF